MRQFTRHIVALSLFSALLMSGGCVMDTYEEDLENDMSGYNTIGYMAVRLLPTDGATRASVGDSFDVGTMKEFQLSTEANHYAIFYNDSQETPIAIGELNGMSSDLDINGGANSSVVYASIVGRNELKEMLQRYNQCYVILNTNLRRDDFMQCTKEDLLKINVDSPFFVDSKGVQYFTMCNSVYVEGGKKKIFTEVDTDKIYQSYQETMEEAWKGNAAVNAYVERLAARFSVRFEKEEYNDDNVEKIFIPENNKMLFLTGLSSNDVPYYAETDPKTGEKYSYRIKITGWGVNALEQSLPLFRRFNENIHYFTGWYDTNLKRAYWSEDLHYGYAVYPWQYRRVIDNTGIPVYQNASNILLNYSYDELNNQTFGRWKYQYAPENTYDFADTRLASSLNNKAELLAGSHIIVCAELLTNYSNTSEWVADDLFRDRNGSFYDTEIICVKALVGFMNNILASHSYLKFTYWDWSNGGVENKYFVDTKGDFALYYKDRKLDSAYIDELYQQNVSLLAAAEFKGGDGKCIIWNDNIEIRDSSGKALQTYSNIDEVNSANNKYLRESTVNDMKSVIFEHVGAVDHFKDGKMYYAIPVGYFKNGSAANDDYSIYSVVRNSSYDILIKGVNGIGTSVDKTDQPIVPNTVTTSDHLFFGCEILDWHPFETTVPGDIK